MGKQLTLEEVIADCEKEQRMKDEENKETGTPRGVREEKRSS